MLKAFLLLLFPALAAAQPSLVFLGDSLTAGYGLQEEEAYPALVEAELAAAGKPYRVVNAGVSGDTSSGALKRLDWILKGKPAAIFVALGANDGLRGVPASVTEKSLDAILSKAKASGAKVFLAGMKLPSNYGRDYNNAFAAIYPRLARRHGVPLLPFLLKGVGGVAGLNQADGVHPTAKGQRLVAAHVAAFLKPLLP